MRVDIKLLAKGIRAWIERTKPDYVRKEELAPIFRVETHHIDQALRILNREGLVSQAHHVVCWDSPLPNKSKCWHPDVYSVRLPEKIPGW